MLRPSGVKPPFLFYFVSPFFPFNHFFPNTYACVFFGGGIVLVYFLFFKGGNCGIIVIRLKLLFLGEKIGSQIPFFFSIVLSIEENHSG